MLNTDQCMLGTVKKKKKHTHQSGYNSRKSKMKVLMAEVQLPLHVNLSPFREIQD